MTAQPSAGFRLSPLVIAVVTMIGVLVLGITQVLPGASSRSDPVGVALVMVAAVLFVLTMLTIAFMSWLSRDERGETAPTGFEIGSLLYAVPAILLVLALAITQVVPGAASGVDPLGVAIAIVVAVVFFLAIVTITFVQWLSADERGAFD
jgi:hypothetical protein